MAGSLFMLAALIGIFLIHGGQTGDYTLSLDALRHTVFTAGAERWLFAAFVIGFAIKIPLLPVHTWLPDAHTEAPTAGSVILAGLLLKTGAYALLRFAFPLFPRAAAEGASLLMILGIMGLFYASWIALAQADMKRLVAYSSIGHMGLVVIGIAAWNGLALSGALLQMINHGLTTAALFIMVGMLDERLQTRALAKVGGLWHQVPVFAGFFLLFGLSALGLPGLNNFVSEVLILLGAFRQAPVIACLGFAAMVVTLIYMLRLVQETLFGSPSPGLDIADLTPREFCILLPLALGVIVLGLYPQPFLRVLAEPVKLLLSETGRVFM
jgi:NADH-quinone oxidoreductase subunit M